ncbi:indolepyruvate oxidoreductase subunit beta [Helicovermis profundi]|uniref:Indolepyruvate oxidoreductase subunit beta n=1 Tax=Helicovermis profundi TaxID=3065157 RepID=A0AAU9EFP6_9FIRM|nr:indolepyruvate oxidoreductase subunit beta [Clostridia bacterium S502]
MKTTNILLVGVGGQGTILASKILSSGLLEFGYDVKMAEIHGMSQRGGSVSTQVRFGKKIHSPVLEEGKVDVIISFEKMETYRWIKFLKEDGIVVMNTYEIPSAPILSGNKKYPDGIIEELSKRLEKFVFYDALDEAVKLGNFKVLNTIMLGSLIKGMNLDGIDWDEIIKNNVKEKFIDINIKAFNRGFELYDNKLKGGK